MTGGELRNAGAADARAGTRPRYAAGPGSVTPAGRPEMPVEYMEGYDEEQRRMATGRRKESRMSNPELQMEDQAAAQREAAKLLAEADARRGRKPRPDAWRNPIARAVYNDAYTRERRRVLSPPSEPATSEPKADGDVRYHPAGETETETEQQEGAQTAAYLLGEHDALNDCSRRAILPSGLVEYRGAYEQGYDDERERKADDRPKAMTLPVLTAAIHAHRTEEARRMSRIEAAREADAQSLARCNERIRIAENAVGELRARVRGEVRRRKKRRK